MSSGFAADMERGVHQSHERLSELQEELKTRLPAN